MVRFPHPSATMPADLLPEDSTYVVIDFETTTPKGYRPEPIDVAAVELTWHAGALHETGRFQSLISPPAHAPVTWADTDQTGITAAMLADAPDAATVLGQLDNTLEASPPHLLVAHNAPTEAGILRDYHHACPILSRTDLLDTVRLARVAYPELGSHRLDVLLHHLQIPRPADRHRAMPDVKVTAEILSRILLDGASDGRWSTVNDLRRVALFTAAANRSQQGSLF